jgi:hypothetical protein
MSNEKKDGDGQRPECEIASGFNVSARPVLAVDVAKYQAYLDDSGLTDQQKQEFLQALWSVVVTFVELGFEVHPLQEVCGQDSQACRQCPKDAFDSVKSDDQAKIRADKEARHGGGLELE